MADVNANIGVQIDTSDALAQLKNLQRQLSQFHTSVAKSSNVAATAQKSLQKNLVNSINSIGAFSAELRTVKTSAESFTDSLEKNKFSMREYFRYAGASTKTFGKLFTSELDTISKVAEDRVKKLQTQYIKLGRDSQGAMKAIAVMPNQLDFSKTSTQLQIAAQKQAIFNQLLKQGSTNLLNFGKNTQWAGRQLMVGFTVPLGILGMKASQTFMEMEKAAIKFKKVYGDLLTSPEETKAALDGITELAKQFTKYGIAVSETVSLSAEAAAAGFQGLDLQRQTTEATRLSVLGQVDAQQALETTIALQNAFQMSSENLASSIDFLNAVENQTVTSLEDITTAIPKVAPVIQQLGGDVKDLAFFLTAMKEGGVNASEGANALKSGLASLINPTSKATAMLADMGININKIVETNKGDLKATVIGFAQALDTLDPLARARAIEQMFGKFQFARLSTLFQNVTRDGTQASRVLDLAGSSMQDLAALSEKELGMTADSAMNKFKKAVEDLQLALVPVGETFLKAVTPIVEFFGSILEKFSGLSDNTKKIITIITIALAGVGPVLLMTFGLLANGVANIIKLFGTLRNGYLRLTGQSAILGEQTQYMTTEQLEAAAAAHSLNQSHATLKQTFDVEKASLDQLIASYQSATRASAAFAAANPGAMLPIPGGKRPKKFAVGKPYVVGGSGNRDSEPAMLAPGETVIPAKMSKKYGGLINGMIAGNIPGYNQGLFPTYTNAVSLLSSGANQALKNKSGYSAAALSSEFASGGAGIQAPIVRAIAESLGATTVPDVISMIKNNPDLAKFGSNISRGVAEELAQVTGNVTDPEVGKIYEKVARREAEKMGGQYKAATDKFLTEITTFEDTTQQRVSQSTGKKRSIGRASLFTNKKSYKSMGFGSIASALGLKSTKGLVKAHMTGRQMSSIDSLSGQGNLSKAAIEAKARMDAKTYDETVKKTTEDPYMASRDRKSPHPQAIKDGKDDGTSYATGVQSGTKKASQSAQAVASRQALYGDGPIDPVAKSMRRQEELRARRAPVAAPRVGIRQRLSGVGSNVSGKLGGGRGIGVSSGLMMASQFIPGQAGQIAGQVSSVAFALQALKMLPGPLKLVAVGMISVVGAVKLFNAVQERARLKVEGLGDAAAASEKQLNTLGDFFGVTARELSRERLKPGETASAIGATQTTAVNSLRGSENFQKDFKNDINALKSANVKDATMIFKALAVQLKGRGFASEQIKTIIQALQQEAGKTSIKLDFKDIGVASEDSITQQAKVIGLKISKTLSDSAKRNAKNSTSGFINTEELASINAAGASMSAVIDGLIGQFEGGEISLEKFQSGVDAINTAILQMPAPTQAELIKVLFSKLGPEASKAAAGIKGVSNQLKVMMALSSGIISAEDPLLNVLKTATDPKVLGRAQNQLSKKIKNFYKIFEIETQASADDAGKVVEEANKDLGEKFNIGKYIKDSFIESKNQVIAFKMLRDAGVDAATAMDLVGNAELALAVINGELTEKMKKQIEWMRKRKEKLSEYQKQIEEASKTEGERTKDILALEEARFNLEEEIIKSKYAKNIYETNEALRDQSYELELVNRQIKIQEENMNALVDPKQKRIDDISYQLEGISFKEDEINDKYDKQSKLLSVITKMNQDLYSIQKKRVSLADALSSGDISSAASIIMDMRAEEASLQATSQQDVLDAAREQELSALGRVSLEKESKKLQYDILTIQRQQSTVLQDQADKIQETIDNLTNNLSDYEEAAADEIYAVNNRLSAVFGRTKVEIQSAMSMIDLANNAGFDMNNKTLITNILDAAIGKANELKKIMAELSGIDTRTPGEVIVDDTNKAVSDAEKAIAEAEKAIAEADAAKKAADDYLRSIGIDPTGSESQTPAVEAPRTPVIGESKYLGSQFVTWDGTKWVDAATYKAPVADTTPAPVSNVEAPTTAIKVPHGAYDANDEPAVVSPQAPVTTLPVGVPEVSPIQIDFGGFFDDFNNAANSGGFISIPSLNIDYDALASIDWSAFAFAKGGIVPKYFARGGFNRGTDTVPAMLTPGEFVVNKKATDGLGIKNLTKINNGEMPGSSVYNYKVDVTLNGSDMNPNDVANAVLTKIKQLESRNIRRQGI